MKLKPEGCKVLVEPDKAEEKTKGGIIIPAKSQQSEQLRMLRGTILAIGPTAVVQFGKEREAKVGDRVIFAQYGGFVIRDDEGIEVCRVLNDEDIVCQIIED